MTNPTEKLPLTHSDLRATIVRILDRTIDTHQIIQNANSQLEEIDNQIRDLRVYCLKNLLPPPSVAESIIPGMPEIYQAIDLACARAKAPIGCSEVAKSAVFNAIWQRMTRVC
jgi:hypothetical protein